MIGGINLDILLEPHGPLVAGTSNPGVISMSPGGVGRNIAEFLGRLGVAVSLIGGAGTDAISDRLLDETAAAGVDISGVYREPTWRAGAYAAVQAEGDLATAVADLTATEALTPRIVGDALERCTVLRAPRLLIADCNVMPPVLQEVIAWANDHAVPLLIEPVSVVKARRLDGLSGSITAITPNEAEAAVLETIDSAGLPAIAHWCITRGAAGARYRCGNGGTVRTGLPNARREVPPGARGHADYPTVPVELVNANGAGDAFVAGMAWALLQAPDDWKRAILTGLAAGRLAVTARETVPVDISRDRLKRTRHRTRRRRYQYITKWRRAMNTPHVKIHPDVTAAQAAGRAVVALESTIISHGMPYPKNVETAREVEEIVRGIGGTPATIAIMDGAFQIGLTEEQIERLGNTPDVMKASRRDVGLALATHRLAATTVATTMIGAAAAGIRLFATGGTGGVHRGYQNSLDVSADLPELAQTPVAVVSAGVKSILDIGRTLEYLETLGVPVITCAADEFPAFYSRKSGFPSPLRLDAPESIAATLNAHWTVPHAGAR